MRSAREIVDQTNALARTFYSTAYGHSVGAEHRFYDFDRPDYHPHERACWEMACEAQRELTRTDPDDALAELADDPAPPEVDGPCSVAGREQLADKLAAFLGARGCRTDRRPSGSIAVVTPRGAVASVEVVTRWRGPKGFTAAQRAVPAVEVGGGYGLRTQAYLCDGPVEWWGAKVLARLERYGRPA